MTDATVDEEVLPKKGSKLPLIIGLLLAVLGGGGAFYVMSSGMLTGAESHAEETEHVEVTALPDIAFVPLEPLVISLNGGANKHLRFRAELEVASAHKAEVESIVPRVIDVMNGYLRALETADLEDPAAIIKLRGQLLRRIQIVTGEGRVKDLLIMEFVLN